MESVSVYGRVPESSVFFGDGDFILFDEIPILTLELPKRPFQALPDISLLEKLMSKSCNPKNKAYISEKKPWHTI